MRLSNFIAKAHPQSLSNEHICAMSCLGDLPCCWEINGKKRFCSSNYSLNIYPHTGNLSGFLLIFLRKLRPPVHERGNVRCSYRALHSSWIVKPLSALLLRHGENLSKTLEELVRALSDRRPGARSQTTTTKPLGLLTMKPFAVLCFLYSENVSLWTRNDDGVSM